MSNLDIIREKLDGGQFTDLEELASGLLSALEGIAMRIAQVEANTREATFHVLAVNTRGLKESIAYWTDEFAELPQTCAYEAARATLEPPAEGCEEDAVEGSEYCKEHGE